VLFQLATVTLKFETRGRGLRFFRTGSGGCAAGFRWLYFVRFWGLRGSIPSRAPERRLNGRQYRLRRCSLRLPTLVIFDRHGHGGCCGKPNELVQSAGWPPDADILLMPLPYRPLAAFVLSPRFALLPPAESAMGLEPVPDRVLAQRRGWSCPTPVSRRNRNIQGPTSSVRDSVPASVWSLSPLTYDDSPRSHPAVRPATARYRAVPLPYITIRRLSRRAGPRTCWRFRRR